MVYRVSHIFTLSDVFRRIRDNQIMFIQNAEYLIFRKEKKSITVTVMFSQYFIYLYSIRLSIFFLKAF